MKRICLLNISVIRKWFCGQTLAADRGPVTGKQGEEY